MNPSKNIFENEHLAEKYFWEKENSSFATQCSINFPDTTSVY